ncbi:hypothetical protein Vi05172_g13061 [Venturia inaequalis]|nr:hypothetical protein Vi05172_g13061 [Venturia inaequalis]
MKLSLTLAAMSGLLPSSTFAHPQQNSTSCSTPNPTPTAAAASSNTCTWAGHCLGAPCKDENDCSGDWICVDKVCSVLPTPAPGCSWALHCLGDPCVTFDDCDGELVCTNRVCAVKT